MNGNRKLKVFYLTMIVVMLVIETAILKGIELTGDNIVALSTILAGLGATFFGANVGEHFAQKKKNSPL